MAESYNRAVASHYAAYRPPLHAMILQRVFADSAAFAAGLDVGCGTGCSTEALAAYCDHVYGIDPSRSMLAEITPHEKITCLKGSGENIPLPDRSIDVVTCAGSLFYADREATAEELHRVCRREAVVVPYDFELLLDDVLAKHGIDPKDGPAEYDHSLNLHGAAGFADRTAETEQVRLNITAAELAHILLSDRHRYEAFAGKFSTRQPFPALKRELRSVAERHAIEAKLYYTKYD